jgi:hypothetical protein
VPFTFHITHARSFFHILATGLKLAIINTFSMAKFATNHTLLLCLDYQLLLWPQLIPHMRTQSVLIIKMNRDKILWYMYTDIHVKFMLFLSQFNLIRNVSTNLSENPKYEISMHLICECHLIFESYQISFNFKHIFPAFLVSLPHRVHITNY